VIYLSSKKEEEGEEETRHKTALVSIQVGKIFNILLRSSIKIMKWT
jgi:hypothetical protein